MSMIFLFLIIISIFDHMANKFLNLEDEMSEKQLIQETLILNQKIFKLDQDHKKIKQYLTYKKINCLKQLQEITMETNDLLIRNQKLVKYMHSKMRIIDQKQKEQFKAKLNDISQQLTKIYQQCLRTDQEMNQLNDLIDQCYLTKKNLNNELQKQRGNIRVYCRFRPFHSNQDHGSIYQLLNQTTLKLNIPRENRISENRQKQYTFNFDHIFDMKQSQQDIFQELCQLIQNSVDGNNVCIFAYGQTGSGKTYTMHGESAKQREGVIPRSIKLIFSQVERSKKYNWNFEISVEIKEVYLDAVIDLIDLKKEDNDKFIKLIAKSPQELEIYIQQASKNRKVAETGCNEHPSRSHLIVTIHIHSRNEEKNLERHGSLNLVDLAGSQRVDQSKVQGDRLRQMNSINKSLTNLRLVISKLANKQQHIPYRSSKLTLLLKDYLKVDSKVLMFVNISPKISDYNQTLCSLKFAEQAKECKIEKSKLIQLI